MRKGFKKFIAIAAAAIVTAGSLSLAACGSSFEHPTGMPQAGEPVSNGGFVVEQGEYYYFINGIESYTSDNTYGVPVKGGLYRIPKANVKTNTKAERVVPSIIVSGTYDAGFYIYGDRVYYTTPNDVPDPVSGETDKSYMYFKSAKLDGSDVKSYFSLDSNSTPYRIVSVADTVYVMYVESNDIYSYNTSTKERTLLAGDTTSYVFNKQDVTDPTVYYTMSVSENQDSDLDPRTFTYNQIYRVRADWTEKSAPGAFDAKAPYDYGWDMDYIEEELGGEIPYTNLGEIVLDGISSRDSATRFNHSETKSTDLQGHTYSLRSYENGGLYYTDKPATSADSSVGSDDNGRLFFIDGAKLASGWDSVKANTEIGTSVALVANAVNLSDTATDSALFYINKEGKQCYLYVKNNTIYRAEVNEKGEHTADPQPVAYDVSGATLLSVDLDTDETYQYVWFSRSNGSGRSIERAVINGEAKNYQNLPFEDLDNSPYKPAKVLNVEHADSWYPFELIGTDLFFADADSDIASTSFNYISTVSLANAEGKLMNNKELAEFTEKYDSLMSSDAKVGLLSKLSGNSNAKLSTALRYYFYTGEATQFDDNIDFATENGKSATFLYTEDEKTAFYAFYNGEGYTDPNGGTLFKESDYKDNGESYRTYSYFVTQLGEMTQDDADKIDSYWETTLEHFTLPEEEEEEGIAWWAWLLIGIGIAVVAVGVAAIVVVLVVKKKNGEGAPEEAKMAVDTTDDRDVDVYSDEPEAPAEETAEEPAEETDEEPAPEETAEEAPVEEAAEEAPVEEASEAPAPEEAPAEKAEEPETPQE